MGKLLPVIFLIVGAAAGGGAGIFLAPAPEMACEDDTEDEDCVAKEEMTEEAEEEDKTEDFSYIAMKNQFVVPIIRDEIVGSMVVLSLSLETKPDQTEVIFTKEPKLRDTFLRVLFDHAQIGGFNGAFTESGRMDVLRRALLESAQSVVGSIVSDVLITDIARQEM